MIKVMIDYLLYITYKFLFFFKKYNSNNLKLRAINGVAIILVCSILFMLLIKFNLLRFNKIIYFLLCVGLFICISKALNNRYKMTFDEVIKRFDASITYSKKK
jgi:heme O synthase-like polyprenyltransferase